MKVSFIKVFLWQSLFLSIVAHDLWAQSTEPGIQESFFQPRPKIFSVSMESLPYNQNFQLDPTQELTNTDLERNSLIKTSLNFPLIWKNKLKVIGTFNYRRETLNLVTPADVPQPETLKLYQTGLNFRYELALKNDQFLMGHVGGNLRSDQLELSDLSYAVSVGWGKRLSSHKKIGFGIGVENTWGRIRYSPLFLYENRINEKWDLSLLLPRQAKLSYYVNPGFHLIAKAKGSSARYLVDDRILLPAYDELEYRQRRISFNLGLEKQLYDWFWIGIHAGITTPVNSVLVETGARSRDFAFDFNPNSDRFLKFSIFIVPPQKLFNKLTGKK